MDNVSAVQWRFFKKVKAGKGAEFAEYFRRNTCTRQVLGNIYQLQLFFMRKGLQDNRGFSRKVILILKIRVLDFRSHYFC